MRATDELRRMLDERGVEWKARPDGVTEWVNDGMTCKAVDRTTVGIEHLTMLIPVLTPEQAIAATLGCGMLTAEQVREAIEENSWKEAFMLFEFNESSWQAIADELNATLGAGTCHDKGGTDENGQQVFNCSECGCVLSLYDRDGSNNLCTGFVFDYPRYCPSCGRKVEG